MTSSDSLSSIHHFMYSTFIGVRFTSVEVMRRVSLVPLIPFRTYRSLYSERFFDADSKVITSSMVFTHMPGVRLLFVLHEAGALNEAAGFTLCYNLFVCWHRALTLRFLYKSPVSYRASWHLLGLDFHQ
jgi:hypothetical protein